MPFPAAAMVRETSTDSTPRRTATPRSAAPTPPTPTTPCLHDPREALGGRLFRRESALRHARPLGRKRIEDDASADRRHRREAANDEAIAAARDDRVLEEQAGKPLRSGRDRRYLRHATQDLGGAEVDANARANREGLLDRREYFEHDVERAGRAPARPRDGDIAAVELVFVHTDEREGGPSAGTGAIGVRAVHLDRPHADFAIERQ